jgi:hypothetical protein
MKERFLVFYKNETLFYITLMLITALIGVMSYGVLPALGIEKPASLLGIKNLWALAILIVAGTGYLCYLQKIDANPSWITIGLIVFLPVFLYGVDTLQSMGVPMRPLVLCGLLITVPALLMGKDPFIYLFRNVPHFRYFGGFCILLTFYYFFNNANIIDLNYAKTADSYGTYSITRFANTLILFSAQLFLGATFLKSDKPAQFFRKLNLIFAIYLLLFSISSLIFYPLNILTVDIDGKRLQHIMIHPGAFSQYMSFIEIYFITVYFYFRNQTGISKKFITLLAVTCIMGFFALLCGVTKTFIATTTLAALIVMCGSYFLENRAKPLRQRLQTLMKFGLILASTGVIVVGTLMLTGMGSIITDRFENADSQDWRFKQWERLTSDMNLGDLLLVGNGMTAGIGRAQQLTYNTQNIGRGKQESAYIHNGYIEHLYDFGLPGLCWLLGLLLLLKEALTKIFSKQTPMQHSILFLGITCLVINFLITVGNTEDFFMVHCPFWYVLTLLYLMTRRKPNHEYI